ncbi:Interleukin-17A [Galemys pyrenaicus]|uniref:Interleukin-17A n=1 Tax=Galemys pyrenaicus TaxID=202257 RepID=A0A8J6A7R3_GALPY|nr:Interleukin-17A [Galemys pyrenaicus]
MWTPSGSAAASVPHPAWAQRSRTAGQARSLKRLPHGFAKEHRQEKCATVLLVLRMERSVSNHKTAKSYKRRDVSAYTLSIWQFFQYQRIRMAPEKTSPVSPPLLSFSTQFQSLLLLLCLMAIAKVGTAMPHHTECPNTEDKKFPQHVNVNLNILNRKTNSRRISAYNHRSTSPWDFHRNEDSDRYPPVIWEAKCRYSGCISAEGKEDHHMNSVAIQQEILVLRREPRNCSHSFRLEKMLVAVGCTCVAPIVQHMT